MLVNYFIYSFKFILFNIKEIYNVRINIYMYNKAWTLAYMPQRDYLSADSHRLV